MNAPDTPSAGIVPIVAVARDRVIGSRGALPWRLPEDLRRFKQTTMGHPLVMGRKTFESIGKPLPGRTSIVVTRQPGYAVPPGVPLARSPEEALAIGAGLHDRVFVIGGEEVYAATLARATEVLATLVHHRFPGDAFFPRLDAAVWHVASREDGRSGELRFSFTRLVRGAGEDACALCRIRRGLPPAPAARSGPTAWDAGFAAVLEDLVEAVR